MSDFVLVKTTDVNNRDLFCEQLIKSGYVNCWPLSIPEDRLVVCVYIKKRQFKLLSFSYDADLSVEDFVDLFL